MTWSNLRKLAGALALVLFVAYGAAATFTGSATVDVAQAAAQSGGEIPGSPRGGLSQSEMWRAVRGGIKGTVSIPNKDAGQLVQSDGDVWRAAKNGPLSKFGGMFLLASIVVIAAFFLIRGRIKIEHGPDPQGRTIERFNALERAVHWLTASSFIVLALTGLNVTYGRYVLKPVLGDSTFGALTYYGKLAHGYIALAFMLGIVMMFLLWVRHNIPAGRDIVWLLKGGGLFSKGSHLDVPRFNAGQKIIFWLVVLGGVSLSLSGLALMFPGQIQPWAGTFGILNAFGGSFPTELSALQEVQLSVLWHSLIALVMIGIVIGHIYIGSLGMEGAIDAVASGQVDLNWAKEHHSLWVAEEEAKAAGGAQQPAE
ncbi:MAG: formate dehydrogenase subunit gamma [Rhodospirillaceae bacterium]